MKKLFAKTASALQKVFFAENHNQTYQIGSPAEFLQVPEPVNNPVQTTAAVEATDIDDDLVSLVKTLQDERLQSVKHIMNALEVGSYVIGTMRFRYHHAEFVDFVLKDLLAHANHNPLQVIGILQQQFPANCETLWRNLTRHNPGLIAVYRSNAIAFERQLKPIAETFQEFIDYAIIRLAEKPNEQRWLEAAQAFPVFKDHLLLHIRMLEPTSSKK